MKVAGVQEVRWDQEEASGLDRSMGEQWVRHGGALGDRSWS